VGAVSDAIVEDSSFEDLNAEYCNELLSMKYSLERYRFFCLIPLIDPFAGQRRDAHLARSYEEQVRSKQQSAAMVRSVDGCDTFSTTVIHISTTTQPADLFTSHHD
jgi:hypothetical protein